jgi:exopolysaccharide biosynthesis polyprenyl glycosylphosphotransferase
MPTTWRSRPWVAARRQVTRRETETAASRHAEISPVWEVLPSAAADTGARRAILRRDARLRRSLAVADVASTFAALFMVIAVLDPGRVHPGLATLLIAPLVVVSGKLIGIYDRDPHVLRKTTIDEAPALFHLVVLYALVLWLGEHLLLRGRLERSQVFELVLVTFLLMTAARLAVRMLVMAVTEPERCVVIGGGDEAARIAQRFADSPSVNAIVVGRVALTDGEPRDEAGSSIPTLGDYEALARVVADHHVERVVIAPESDGQEEILEAIRTVKALGVKVSVLPRLLEVVGSTSTFDDLNGMSLLGVRQFGLSRSSQMLKRAMDVAAAGMGLIALGPLFLMLTVAIKVDSRGPVLFRQRRTGRRGETFWMLKFRSMVEGADEMKDEIRELNEVTGGLFKISGDPRITRVGQFLRRTSLDELPQLLNVVHGDMSLVGPRPLVPDEDALIEGWQRRRLAVKPGMTGLWQIFWSSRIPMHEMVKIDYIYGANWSLWLDVRILLRTVPYILGRRGQ